MNTDRFRFRVWNKLGKYYELEEYLKLTQDGYLRLFHDSIKYPLFGTASDYIVEQCTGLKDKNGELIYEGDVLRATCTDGKHIDYPVGWWDGAFHLYYVDKSLIAETGTIQFCLRGLVSVKNCCYREIIGNVHEYEREENE